MTEGTGLIDERENRALWLKLLPHVNHTIEIVTYGRNIIVQVAVECTSCGEVLVTADNPDLVELE